MMVARSPSFRTVRGMIRLTRLRSPDPLYVNPDHIERLDRHHDTIVHLLNGNEYIVVESPEEIVERVTYLRAKAIALAARLAADGLAELGDALTASAAAQPLPRVSEDEEG
jgi:uncharacterized protein YlzI (FlbEa/FlbD family)